MSRLRNQRSHLFSDFAFENISRSIQRILAFLLVFFPNSLKLFLVLFSNSLNFSLVLFSYPLNFLLVFFPYPLKFRCFPCRKRRRAYLNVFLFGFLFSLFFNLHSSGSHPFAVDIASLLLTPLS